MSVLTLEVESRDPQKEAAKEVRKAGMLPAIFYKHGVDNVAVKMDYQTFRKLFRQAGESTLVELNIDGGKRKETVLIHDYQQHAVTGLFTHVDFMGVNMDEEVVAHVPVVLNGVSPAVKDLSGVMEHLLDVVDVKCLPGKIPHHIELDVSGLVDFTKSLLVSDLVVDKGVTILNEADQVVVMVSAPRVESEEAPAAEGEAGGSTEAAA